MGYLEDGILTLSDLVLPPEERFGKGPVAVIECVQNIPCNPCVDSCPQKAISITPTINDLPVLDFKRCNGCGMCIANCPGLAIFLIEKNFEQEKARVGLPYEFLPLPDIGETVHLLNRAGKVVGEGQVHKIRNTKAQDRTPVVFLVMDRDLAMEVRFFRRRT